ncbi:class I SAM-dependent methyltransferase [Candidatus Pelagibacter bacterium]|nr:class I SAM-dependent methyltransferase [Candidatus Pelagibacter bacterium]
MSKIIKLLHDLEAIDKDRLEIYYPRVRDRNDIRVLRDTFSQVIVLSKSDHIEKNYYSMREEKKSITMNSTEIRSPKLYDNIRRAKEFGKFIKNKRWLDFGCGLGGMLDEIATQASSAAGLEPNNFRKKLLIDKGYLIYQSIEEIEDKSLDIITLFHVLEHLLEPVKTLNLLKKKLSPNGKMIIEVPHARDMLFTMYDCEKFKQFTFWSEHLILHTRMSLKLILNAATFSSIKIFGYQRYPLANHLYWLSKGKPGGHEKWNELVSHKLDLEYKNQLDRIDRTDTLIAIVQ